MIAGLLMMRIENAHVRRPSASPLEHILEGFRFVSGTAPIRAILLLVGLVSVVGMPYSVLMPVSRQQILHGNARTLGVLMGATGIGALCGALTLASRKGVHGLGKYIFVTCGGFGAFLILFRSRAGISRRSCCSCRWATA